MNWTRRHTAKPKHRKEWRAKRGSYRIVWRDQAFDVSVPPAYQCCVRIFVIERGCSMWNFVDRRRPFYRTFKAAKDACERHADPNYRPVRKQRKTKRKAPMKVCSQCNVRIHVRRAVCDCGYKFPKKMKA